MRPISFGSNYKAYVSQCSKFEQKEGFFDLISFCLENEIQHNVNYNYKQTLNGVDLSGNISIEAPNTKDVGIEAICANKGIKYVKRQKNVPLDSESILKRVSPPYKHNMLVLVKADRLEEIAKEQANNLIDSAELYKGDKRLDALDKIKSGEELTLPTLYVDASVTSNEDAIEDLEDYGSDFILPSSYFIDLNLFPESKECALYFAMRELGLNDVPVYIPKKNYPLMKAMDLIQE